MVQNSGIICSLQPIKWVKLTLLYISNPSRVWRNVKSRKKCAHISRKLCETTTFHASATIPPHIGTCPDNHTVVCQVLILHSIHEYWGENLSSEHCEFKIQSPAFVGKPISILVSIFAILMRVIHCRLLKINRKCKSRFPSSLLYITLRLRKSAKIR